jgi:hypothetical protein
MAASVPPRVGTAWKAFSWGGGLIVDIVNS